jgi:IclR family acetate operon transcriptional repressor
MTTATDRSPGGSQPGDAGRTGAAVPVAGVQAIDRAVAILLCFDARQPDLGVSDIARRTGLSTSTAHRLLAAMQTNRLVRQTSGRRYGLGPLLVQLSRSGALPTTVRDAALPLMTALRDEVDETIALHELLATGDRVVVEQVESRQSLRRTYTDIGVSIALPAGAPGKAIFAMMADGQRQAWSARNPDSPLARSDLDEPGSWWAEARVRGWAGSTAERMPGIRGVAAAIFDHTGDVVGALGVSVPEARMDDARADELGLRVKEVAWEISELLGASAAVVGATGRPGAV